MHDFASPDHPNGPDEFDIWLGGNLTLVPFSMKLRYSSCLSSVFLTLVRVTLSYLGVVNSTILFVSNTTLFPNLTTLEVAIPTISRQYIFLIVEDANPHEKAVYSRQLLSSVQ
jgi:hypothetical protein